jgi:hypothetical protein
MKQFEVQEHRYDSCGSDSPEMRYETKLGTDLGDAIFELLVYKFCWQATAKRKKEET